MDDIIFYQPPLASKSQPPCLLGAPTTSNTPGGPITYLSDCQTASQPNQQNGILKDQKRKSRGLRDPPQKGHDLDPYCGNDTTQDQENMIATQNSPNSGDDGDDGDDDDDDFPEIDELSSGTRQKSMLASKDPNGDDDDDGFIDIDELLSGMQQKSVPTSADLNSAAMAEMVENGTRGGSPTDSSRSTAGSSRVPIILSDDESAGAESETDYSDLDVDVRAKSDSDPPHVAENEQADGDGLGFGAALISDRLATDHQDDHNDHDGVIDQPQLCLLADRPRPAFPDPGSDTHQASELQGIRSYHLNVTKELEVDGFDVDSRSTKGRTLSAVSDKNLASGSNISALQDGQPDDTQSPQLALAAASPHQSDLKTQHVPKRLRRGATRNDCRKRPRTMAPTRLATTTNTASAAPKSADLEEAQCCTEITAPDEEWELRDTDQEMIDDGSADDSDKDYADMSDAAGSKRSGRPRSRKRVRRTKDRKQSDMESSPTHPLDVPCQAATAPSSISTQESEEMPIHGYFTLKTVASKVVYCLTFSQELLPRPQHQGQRQESTPDLENPQSITPDSGICRAPLRRQRRPWTREEDATLRKMKKKGHSWEEIHAALPCRSKGTLQVRYSTKLRG